MFTINAHFDGKTIVPDEPHGLKANQRLRIQVEPIADSSQRTNFGEWIGLASMPNQPPYDPAEEDSLWENGTPSE